MLHKRTVILIVAVAGIFLFWVDPGHAWFAPKCPFFMLTGLQCPACGSQRAIHQLLHGNLAGAFRYNSFLFISLPYLFALILLRFDSENRYKRLREFCYNFVVIRIYIVLILSWWVFRNIVDW